MSLKSNSAISSCLSDIFESFITSPSGSFCPPNLCSTYLKTWSQRMLKYT
jgi:hypothetical protein